MCSLPGVAQRRRVPGQQAGRAHLGGHVRDLELDGLEVGDGMAELAPSLRVGHRGFQRGLGDPDREGGDADAAAVQDLQRVHEPVALLAQEVLGGHAAVLEDQLGGVGGAHAELVLLLARPEALHPALQDEGGDALVALRAVGHGHDHRGIGDAPVGDEGLRPVEHPVPAVAHGRRLRAPRVRPGAVLGEAPAADLLAAREGHQVLLLLLLAAGQEDVPRARGCCGRPRRGRRPRRPARAPPSRSRSPGWTCRSRRTRPARPRP